MTKIVPYIFAALLFLCPKPAPAQILILPIDDLLMTIPDFNNAPNYNFWGGMQGQLPPDNSTKQPRAKSEQELLDLAWDIFPNAETIKIWNKKLIIKLKD